MEKSHKTSAELFAAQALASQVRNELTQNILPYWMQKMSRPDGGFYGRINGNEDIDPEAPIGNIMIARMLWTFASAYRVLQNEEYALAGKGETGAVFLFAGVYIAVAQLVIEVIQAHFHEIPQIRIRIAGDKVPQFPEMIPGGTQQIPDLQGIPVCQILFAADEAAGFVVTFQGLDQAPVNIHIRRGQPVQNDHDVDIAVFIGLSPQIAALQTHEPYAHSKVFLQRLHMVVVTVEGFSIIGVQLCALIPAKFNSSATDAVVMIANPQLLNAAVDCRFNHFFGLVLRAEGIIGMRV